MHQSDDMPQLPRTDDGSRRTGLAMLFRRWDLLLLGAFFAVTNSGLVTGRGTDLWAFYPEAVAQGQIWRLVTDDFAHASLYHLAVNGLFFVLLYLAIREKRLYCRVAYVFLSGAGSTLFAVLFETQASITGLRGISGVAHGLLAVWALEVITSPAHSRGYRVFGGVVLLSVIGKLILELVMGRSLLAPIHLGYVGSPNVPCHVGGLLAGSLAFICLRHRVFQRGRRSRPERLPAAPQGLLPDHNERHR